MNSAQISQWTRVAVVAIGVGLFTGCSGPAPEERLIEVGQDVDDMQSRLASLNEEIAGHEEAIQQLRKERQQARAKLMTLEERLERRATDLAIFRAAQSALLEEPALQDAVVLASVEDGVVTLKGSVSSVAEEQQATKIVSAIPGVESTLVRLELIDKSDAGDK